MRHFIAYHNVERIGRRLAEGDPHGVDTKKPVAQLIGEYVWFIEGLGSAPKEYFLSSLFVVTDTGPSASDAFRNEASGPGHTFVPPPRLNDLSWFQELFRSVAHFSTGLQEVTEPRLIEELTCLANDAGVELSALSEGEPRRPTRELDRVSLDDAQLVFERLFSGPQVRRECCQVLADAIIYAHETGPACWEVTMFADAVRLNVGQPEVLFFKRAEVDLLLDASLVQADDGALRAYLSPPSVIYRNGPPQQIRAELPAAAVSRYYPTLRAAHQGFMAHAAARKSASPFKDSYSHGVILYLRQVLEVPVPAPAYFDEESVVSGSPHSTGPESRAVLGAGHGDPMINRLVERAAVSLVKGHYNDEGWGVSSVEQQCCGYDLECRRGAEVRHVEVKGIRGDGYQFLVTAGEVNRARDDDSFWIAAVTNALSAAPVLRQWSGRQFCADFDVVPTTYRACIRNT